ncbi:MAG: hypothetical protein QXJ26_00515 [Desulfurococcaceae archaeon]
MGKPVNSLITLRAYLVDRSTGEIVASKAWRNRLPILLLVKLSSWLYALSDEYDPRTHKLLVHVECESEDDRVMFLKSKFKQLNIALLEDPLQVVS